MAIIILSAGLGSVLDIAKIGVTPAVYWLLGALTGMLAVGILAGGD